MTLRVGMMAIVRPPPPLGAPSKTEPEPKRADGYVEPVISRDAAMVGFMLEPPRSLHEQSQDDGAMYPAKVASWANYTP